MSRWENKNQKNRQYDAVTTKHGVWIRYGTWRPVLTSAVTNTQSSGTVQTSALLKSSFPHAGKQPNQILSNSKILICVCFHSLMVIRRDAHRVQVNRRLYSLLCSACVFNRWIYIPLRGVALNVCGSFYLSLTLRFETGQMTANGFQLINIFKHKPLPVEVVAANSIFFEGLKELVAKSILITQERPFLH